MDSCFFLIIIIQLCYLNDTFLKNSDFIIFVPLLIVKFMLPIAFDLVYSLYKQLKSFMFFTCTL